jgi:hypothetical protein
MEWSPLSYGIAMRQSDCVNNTDWREATDMQITTIGIDLAKNVFQVHGVDQRGEAVLRKQLRRKKVTA